MPTCRRCGTEFEVSASISERYPGWTPDLCRSCYAEERGGPRSGSGAARASRGGGASAVIEENLPLDEVLRKYTEGPDTGVFTDGSANPNPGPGGWGAVYVVDGEIVDRAWGHDPDTTNNRMELTALIHGADLVPEGTSATLYTDSRLCVDTVNDWAAGWEARGWKRRTGEIANLDLVQHLYRKLKARPELTVAWVPGHSGYRWNEYADSLSTAYLREEL